MGCVPNLKMLHTSQFWVDHYRKNLQKQRINWSQGPSISQSEKGAIIYSLKAWQLGETSDGSHLLRASRKYASKIDDPVYVESVKLFIKEEQKHGANLGRYIDLIGEERSQSDWGDTLFRKVRYFNTNMELWTITVIIVESAAQIFYQALHDATNCSLLKEICVDILKDESHHIKFQNERLKIILDKKSIYTRAIRVGLYGALFFLTIHAIWFGHRKAFKAGNVDKRKFFDAMYYKFMSTMKFCFSRRKVASEKPKLALIYLDRS